ncbi:hypothetical protein XFF6991_4899 [Xanthomonas phaseoli pv. phaseoli]|uniref:Transposase n=1 Tax=Xanthomonas campestris pv. phaseoli TaxID=317013 RepID=A0A7Z7J715_XANCH|nr:hypothetical protein XFF6991_4899 [Xanthomonas phaseoli pv. phaseoli]
MLDYKNNNQLIPKLKNLVNENKLGEIFNLFLY